MNDLWLTEHKKRRDKEKSTPSQDMGNFNIETKEKILKLLERIDHMQ